MKRGKYGKTKKVDMERQIKRKKMERERQGEKDKRGKDGKS